MSEESPSSCPCGSGQPYKRCCRPLHRGQASPSAERLMRSRFSAYALGLGGYILKSTYPGGPMDREDVAAWRAEVADFCATTRFESLKILATAEEGEDALVHFRATLRRGDRLIPMEERSRFRRHRGRWAYYGG